MKNFLLTKLSIFLLLLTLTAKSQINKWGEKDLDSSLDMLSININYLDSCYFLFSKLKVTGKEKVYLQKKIILNDYFSFQYFDTAEKDATLYLFIV